MKPGPGVSVLWGAVAKVPQLYARLRGYGLAASPGTTLRSAGETPALLPRRREGVGSDIRAPSSPHAQQPTRSRTIAGPLSQALEK